MQYYAVKVFHTEYVCNAEYETSEKGTLLFRLQEDAHRAFELREKLVDESQTKNRRHKYSDLCNLKYLVLVFREHGIECEILRIDQKVTLR